MDLAVHDAAVAKLCAIMIVRRYRNPVSRSRLLAATPNNNGGYDYDLVSQPPDRLICKVCHLPSRDPYLSVCCGHVFCKSCLDKVKNTTAITNACPVCRDKKFETFPQKEANREIKSLHIYCTNKAKGCKWQGELNDINNHLENSRCGCQFEEVKCSNECGKMIQRRYLTSHVKTKCPCRKINCQYCHHTGEYQFIKGQHKEECPKLPLPCPNECEVRSVPREDMEAHRKECPLEMIKCEYYNVGCKRVKLARKDLEEHDNEKLKEHLMMTKNQLDVALKQINTLAVLVNTQLCPNTSVSDLRSIQLDALVTMFKYICPVTIKMTGYKEKKENEIEWYSDPFYTHNNGYKVCLCIHAAGDDDGKGTHLSVFLYLMKGPHDDELTWPLRETFEVKLLNQISDSEHYSGTLDYDDDDDDTRGDSGIRVTESDRSGYGRGWQRYISNEDLNKITPTCQYLKDDCLFFQVTKF